MNRIALLLFSIFMASWQLNAQATFDVITFENGFTNPMTKTYNSTAVHNLNGYDWILPGVYLGTMTNDDYKISNQSARFRKLNDQTGADGYMEMQEDYADGLEFFGFMARMYGNDVGGKLEVSYSVNAGTTWTVLDTFVITNVPTRYESHDHIQQAIRFRIKKVDNTDARINIDSIYCIPMDPPNPNITATNYLPTGTIHPSVNQLVIQFDQHFMAGSSGGITLHNQTNNTSTAYNLGNPNLELDTLLNRVVVNNVSLDPLSSYYVTYDSTIIESEYNNDLPDGIYNNTNWTFQTSLAGLSNVNELFDSCDQWGMMGIFKQYSVADGSKRWQCVQENGENYISMSALEPNGNAVANDDWLVSYLPFDFNGKVPQIYFKERKSNAGTNVRRKLWHTTAFNINVSTTNWTEVIAMTDTFGVNEWVTTRLALNEQNFTVGNGILAIQYVNDASTEANKVYKWDLDSFVVMIDTTTGMEHIENLLPSFAVTYPVQQGQLSFVLLANENILGAKVVVRDILGRPYATQILDIHKGHQKYKIDNLVLQSGMNFITIETPNGTVTRKFIYN